VSGSVVSFFSSSFPLSLSLQLDEMQQQKRDQTKQTKPQTHLDRVVDRLGEVAAQTGDGAREVERRRRRVDRRADGADGRQGVVGGVLQAARRDVPVHKGVAGRVEQGLALRRGRLLLGGQPRPGRDRVRRGVRGRVDRGEVLDGRGDDDVAVLEGDLERGGGDLQWGWMDGGRGVARRRRRRKKASKVQREKREERRERREREAAGVGFFLHRSRRIDATWVASRKTLRPLFAPSFSEMCFSFLPQPTPATA